ncbi:zinc finger protein NUTCRACKER-like [Populus alba x Populus x berolinensis]|nr:zinc finger protein NUTCRACKER-like [Populus alba x Populus x berolinensis]
MCMHCRNYRKDSFITHRAFCDALAEESARISAHQLIISQNPNAHALLLQNPLQTHHPHSLFSTPAHHQISFTSPWDPPHHQNPCSNNPQNPVHIKPETTGHFQIPASLLQEPPLTMPSHKGLLGAPTFQSLSNAATSQAASHHLSATALLQKAASVGATQTSVGHSHMTQLDMGELGSAGQVHVDSVSHVSQGPSYNLNSLATWQKSDRLTRDFLGLTAPECGDHHGHAASNANGSSGSVNVSMNVREILTYTGGVGFHQQQYSERDHSLLKPHGGFGFAQPSASEAWGDC